MNSLCYTCCTHSPEGNEIYRLQKCEMSTCCFLKFSPSSYQNFNLYFFSEASEDLASPNVLWNAGCIYITRQTQKQTYICMIFSVFRLPPFGHLWKDMVLINSQHFIDFMSWRPNSASNEHILIQVMSRGHNKMAVFGFKHSASSPAAGAFRYKERWFYVSRKSRGGFIQRPAWVQQKTNDGANCIWGHVRLNSCRNYFQNNQASTLIPFGLSSTTMFRFQQICCRKLSRTDREDVTGNRPLLTVWKRKGRGEGVCVVNEDMNSWDWILVDFQIIIRD